MVDMGEDAAERYRKAMTWCLNEFREQHDRLSDVIETTEKVLCNKEMSARSRSMMNASLRRLEKQREKTMKKIIEFEEKLSRQGITYKSWRPRST